MNPYLRNVKSKYILNMENLNDFMLLFRMELNPNYQPSKEELVAMKQAWGSWIGNIGQQARLVSSHQLGFEGKLVSNDSHVNDGIERHDSKSISGNLVLKASDLNEAAEIAKGCPILAMGGTVEVRNTLNVF